MHTSPISGICADLNIFVAVTLMVAAVLNSLQIQSVERLLVGTLHPAYGVSEVLTHAESVVRPLLSKPWAV